jgi:cytoskeletal protein RodZ
MDMMEQSIGSILRQKREEKKLSLDQVFNAIHIRVSYLQAIENDALDQLPSLAQAHGFIHLYADFLDLDPFILLEPQSAVSEPLPVEPTTEEITPDKKDKREGFDTLLKQGKETLNEKVKGGSQHIQESLQQIKEKIPYRIVKKVEASPPVPSTEESPQSAEPKATTPDQKNYKAMCKAIGVSLRQKRESLGLSLADVERQTRIREIYLYSLEEGNLSDLPSTVQGRGMLGNYATFMGLDSDAFLSRFADALQQKRLEALPAEKEGIPLPTPTPKQSVSGWRRLLSPDLIFTGGLFLVFFVFIIWGSVQLVGINSNSVQPTTIPISDLLLASGTPVSSDLVTIMAPTVLSSQVPAAGFTPVDNLQETLSATNTGTIQLVIVAHYRAFMKITVDGKDGFTGRVVPGTIYSYSGNTAITLLTGDGSALEVYYNQTDLGILGASGQVIDMQFTQKGSTNLGALNTATPAPTQLPTYTQIPTATPTVTPPLPLPTETIQSTNG